MAALSNLPAVEDIQKVRHKAKNALEGASPCAKAAFKALFDYLVTQKKLSQARFSYLSPDATTGLITANDGQAIGAGTATLYAVYGQKQADATASYLIIFDNGTDDNLSTSTGPTLSLPFEEASVAAGEKTESFWMNPRGTAIANGLRAASVTDADGYTISSAAADAPFGFVISGA